MKLKNKRIPCLGLGPLPRISHGIYAKIPKSEEKKNLTPSILDKGYSTLSK
jgi:hypothetical protein